LPVCFARLRIAGFKSFAEPVSVEILPGLTGIVGPNGCGKSNVVEALRWAMGENSARSLRGGEMDDVIFAGTAHRPSRNIAEVTLALDAAEGVAPPPFHDKPELEISRRIERGAGSTYRVNGREVRARDVQTLFADLASGAHSSAMVGQGRIGAVVNARPEQRRMILEEAAGITGLHARRHEAELKLRAAEANLARAEDLRGQLEAQLTGLKRQARQASRYRNLSGAIRDAEAECLAVQRARAEADRMAARAALLAAEQAAQDATAASRAAAAAAAAGAALPALRETEGEARTGLERHRLAGGQIAAEGQRAREALAAAAQRLAQLDRDLTHADQLARDAAAAETRLAAEDFSHAEADAAHPARGEAAASRAVAAEAAVRDAEVAAQQATEAAAQATAQHHAATQAQAQAEQRHRRLAGQHAAAVQERDRIAAEAVTPERIAQAQAEQAEADTALAAARGAADTAERERAAAHAALAAAREGASVSETTRAKLAAEAQALAEVLAVKDGERWPPMVDALTVADGLEAALGAALGEELTSAANRDAARHWRELPPLDPLPALPPGAVALAAQVQGPAALVRALSQIGLVSDAAAGDAAQPALAPGQSLVSRGGGVWRWDGYTIRAGTPTAAAVRLRQRNRLAALRAELFGVAAAAAQAREAADAAQAAERAATAADTAARAARRDAEQRAERARTAAAGIKARAAAVAARLQAATDQAGRLGAEAAEAAAALAQAAATLAALPDMSALRTALDVSRQRLAAARAAETAARAERDGLLRDHAARAERRAAIAAERADWRLRAEDAAGRVADLRARRAACATDHAALAEAPAAIAGRQAAAAAALQAAEAAHRRAADSLAAATQAASVRDRAARAAEQALAAAREAVVRAEGQAAQAEHAWGQVAERILDRFGAQPALPAVTEAGPEAEDKARRKLDRLTRERDEMGPVNLRAELEATEVEHSIAAITTEREELTAAIAKLRGSIGHLNREGRERLADVFQQVDRHFQALFTRMFGGGRAHLALVGSDDPLEAGLEIYAQPPGKKLATLSLLSGGEQALTALSLIFAVFRCNPAPVCVLDEVDAPLDDANVDRFCTLLEDMVRDTGTRFLVVTHHSLTMARMDRLYGVTMQERGVSRVLSVDLARATAFSDTPRLAAE
jgi:chromosome segregation protein